MEPKNDQVASKWCPTIYRAQYFETSRETLKPQEMPSGLDLRFHNNFVYVYTFELKRYSNL